MHILVLHHYCPRDDVKGLDLSTDATDDQPSELRADGSCTDAHRVVHLLCDRILVMPSFLEIHGIIHLEVAGVKADDYPKLFVENHLRDEVELVSFFKGVLFLGNSYFLDQFQSVYFDHVDLAFT